VATNQISIADLWGACEVYQLTAAGYDIDKRHPLVASWLARVQQATQPHFDDVSAFCKQFGAEHAYDFEKVMP
jgi:glutathione S-transferase